MAINWRHGSMAKNHDGNRSSNVAARHKMLARKPRKWHMASAAVGISMKKCALARRRHRLRAISRESHQRKMHGCIITRKANRK